MPGLWVCGRGSAGSSDGGWKALVWIGEGPTQEAAATLSLLQGSELRVEAVVVRTGQGQRAKGDRLFDRPFDFSLFYCVARNSRQVNGRRKQCLLSAMKCYIAGFR